MIGTSKDCHVAGGGLLRAAGGAALWLAPHQRAESNGKEAAKWASTRGFAHSGNDPHDYFGFVNPPVVHASTVLYRDAASMAARSQKYTYGTRGTPTTDALAQAIDALEGSAGTILAVGLAAVTVPPLAFLSAGDHLLIVDLVYHPTRNFADTMLKRLGVEVEYYDPHVGAGIVALIRPNTRVVFTESLRLQHVRGAGHPGHRQAARAAGAIVMMDNTGRRRCSSRPLDHGVDISIHAATKYPAAIPTCCSALCRPTRPAEQLCETFHTLGCHVPVPTTSHQVLRGCAPWVCGWIGISAALAIAGWLRPTRRGAGAVSRAAQPSRPRSLEARFLRVDRYLFHRAQRRWPQAATCLP
jgi:cystathionine beta-lyase